ncbi:putative gustatory receptor 94a [Calliphora vicina]|uniref:putative gustatory receptor 94a n=1 Tax=Calliphora vicina TaxID=7373 RepID=UPI00325C162B
MNKTQLVKYIIAFLIGMLSLIGLNSNIYSWRTKRFYVNYFLVVWCITIIILFTMIYIRRLYYEIITEELDLKNAVTLYYYMNIFGAATNYLSQLLNTKSAVDFFNVVQLFETMEYVDVEMEVIQSSILLVTLKTIIFPIIIEITLILRQLRDDDEDRSLLWTVYTLYPLVIANIIPNCLFGIFVICRQFTMALNRQMRELEKEANFLQNIEQICLHKRFYRMQKFCNLADKLDELAEKYSLICSQTLAYMSLCTTPLMASLLCNLFGITAGFFRQYYALADTLINEESYDVFNAVTNGVFLIISFLEIALHSLVADQSIEAVKETGLILKRIKLDNADVRFKKAVEKFSFEILVIDFKIQPMRLLNIDLGLLHDVLSAVTSFLLILIQSDLTLRFSLK